MKLVILTGIVCVLAVNPLVMALPLTDGQTHIIDDNFYMSTNLILDYNNYDTPGTRVEVVDGGDVKGLYAYLGSSIDISGGSVGDVGVYGWGSVIISGGTVEQDLRAHYSSEVTISGGTIGDVKAESNATINMSGGTIVGGFGVMDSANINFSGGRTDNFYAIQRGTATMSGGTIDTQLAVFDNGIIYLEGTDFEYNGQSLSYGDKLSDIAFRYERWRYGWFEYYYYSGTITGILADGTALNNTFNIFNDGGYEGDADIIIIPEPCSLILLGLGGLILRRRRA